MLVNQAMVCELKLFSLLVVAIEFIFFLLMKTWPFLMPRTLVQAFIDPSVLPNRLSKSFPQ